MTTPNTCRLCNEKPATWNGFVCDECRAKAGLQEKAILVLENSDSADWGMVKLTPGTINHVPAESELVGYWHQWGEGVCWVSLMMPLDALMDRTTLLHAEIARRRSENLPLMGTIKPQRQPRRTTSGTKRPKAEEPTPQSKTIEELQALRERLLS